MTSMTGSTGYGQKTSTGTLKRGGVAGERIPKGYRVAQLQNFTPEQMAIFQQYGSSLGPDSYLSKLAGGDEETFNQIERPALKQFSGLQGNIASRFSGMGLGGRRSSGFQNTQNQAAMDFASQLQSQRQNLQQTAIRDLGNLTNSFLSQRPYERQLTEKPKPWWQELATAAAPGVAQELTKGAVGSFSGQNAIPIP